MHPALGISKLPGLLTSTPAPHNSQNNSAERTKGKTVIRSDISRFIWEKLGDLMKDLISKAVINSLKVNNLGTS